MTDTYKNCLRMVLLFHSPSPWTHEKLQEWAQLQEPLLNVPGNGWMRDRIHDVSTKRLCDVIRWTLRGCTCGIGNDLQDVSRHAVGCPMRISQ